MSRPGPKLRARDRYAKMLILISGGMDKDEAAAHCFPGPSLRGSKNKAQAVFRYHKDSIQAGLRERGAPAAIIETLMQGLSAFKFVGLDQKPVPDMSERREYAKTMSQILGELSAGNLTIISNQYATWIEQQLEEAKKVHGDRQFLTEIQAEVLSDHTEPGHDRLDAGPVRDRLISAPEEAVVRSSPGDRGGGGGEER